MKPNSKISAAVAANTLGTERNDCVCRARRYRRRHRHRGRVAGGGRHGGARTRTSRTCQLRSQAITGDQLRQLNVVSFSDLLKYTPNVTFSGNGPGTGNIFMRGLSSGGSGNQSQSTTAPVPERGAVPR